MRKFRAQFCALAALAMLAASPSKADDFYKNKRLTFLINFAAGGPTDIEGRLVARHIAKHIPGNPAVIIQNMDGAGGLIGTNYMGEIAPKDGTTMGYLTGAALAYLISRDRQRVDFLTYNILGFQPGTQIYYVRKDTKPRIEKGADVFKAKNLVMGGLAADSAKDLQLRLLADTMGLTYKYVTGYKGSAGARLAFDRGEINLFAESVPSYKVQVEPSVIDKGIAIPLFSDPGWNGKNYYDSYMIKGMNVKPFNEFYKDVTGREPSGKPYEMYKKILATDTAMLRMMVLPPGAPAEAVKTLRAALRGLNSDKQFAAEAQKLVNFVPQFEAGDNLQDIVANALKASDEDRKWFAEYIKNAKK